MYVKADEPVVCDAFATASEKEFHYDVTATAEAEAETAEEAPFVFDDSVEKVGQPLPGILLTSILASLVFSGIARAKRKEIAELCADLLKVASGKVILLTSYISTFMPEITCCQEWQHILLRL